MVFVPKEEEAFIADLGISEDLRDLMEHTLDKNIFTYSLMQQAQRNDLKRAWLVGFNVCKIGYLSQKEE